VNISESLVGSLESSVERLYSSNSSAWSVDSSNLEEDEFVLQRLVLAKGILQQKIEKEDRGNAKLQVSLENKIGFA